MSCGLSVAAQGNAALIDVSDLLCGRLDRSIRDLVSGDHDDVYRRSLLRDFDARRPSLAATGTIACAWLLHLHRLSTDCRVIDGRDLAPGGNTCIAAKRPDRDCGTAASWSGVRDIATWRQSLRSLCWHEAGPIKRMGQEILASRRSSHIASEVKSYNMPELRYIPAKTSSVPP